MEACEPVLCVLAFFCSALVFVAVSAACVVVVGAAAVLTAPPCCCCGCEAEAEGAVVFPAAVELDDPLVLPVDSRAGVWGLLLLSAAEPSGLGSRLDCEEDWEVRCMGGGGEGRGDNGFFLAQSPAG